MLAGQFSQRGAAVAFEPKCIDNGGEAASDSPPHGIIEQRKCISARSEIILPFAYKRSQSIARHHVRSAHVGFSPG